MNYSKNIKKISIGKRILILCLIVGMIFGLIGFGLGSLIHHEAKAAEKQSIIYGLPDGKMYEDEMPIEWKTGTEFEALDVPLSEDLQQFIYYLAEAYGIDFTFVIAMIEKESNYNPETISITGDYGLMQINTVNHEYLTKELGIHDFLDPYSNVEGGMFILRKLFEKYETPEKVLMAYNMGESGASRLWQAGIFESKYSKQVIEIQNRLKGGN